MHAHSYYSATAGGWRRDSERRLMACMAVSTVLIALLLTPFRLPPAWEGPAMLELVVDIVHPRTLVRPPPPVPAPVTEDPPPIAEPVTRTSEPRIESEPAEESAAQGQARDWQAERDRAIADVLDEAEREALVAINPRLEAARREAAEKFRPSEAPGERPVWDNVEKDQLGRTILRSGNCFKVIDDPSAVNRWVFENFDQFLVQCTGTFGGRKGRELPWVDDVRERHRYLQQREAAREEGRLPWDPP